MAKGKDKDQVYPVQLTWKQTWIVILTFCGIIGTIFAAGIKVQNEISKVEIAIIRQGCQDEVNSLKSSLGRQLTEATENMTFYKNQYSVTNKRLKACMDGVEYIDSIREAIGE